jgi:hypothetical protein
MTGEKKVIVYNHIPKTAGMMVHHVLTRQYDKVFMTNAFLSNSEKYHFLRVTDFMKDCDCGVITGHIFYDYKKLNLWGFKQLSFFTILRDPIRRMLSHYYYMFYNAPSFWTYNLKLNNPTFAEWSRGRDNFIIRYLLSKYGQPITEADYQAAKRRLEEDYLFVGITEQLNETLFLLYKKLQWRFPPFYLREVNATRNPADLVRPSEEDMACLVEQNQYDIALYNLFREKFANSLLGLSKEIRKELNWYLQTQQDIVEGKVSIGVQSFLRKLGCDQNDSQQEVGLFIFGTGQGGYSLYRWLREHSVCNGKELIVKGFFDNDSSKHGQFIDNVIISPPQLKCVRRNDYVIVSSISFFNEMKAQLLNLGLTSEQIIHPCFLLEELLQDKTKDNGSGNEVLLTAWDVEVSLINRYEKELYRHILTSTLRPDTTRIAIYAEEEKQIQLISMAIDRLKAKGIMPSYHIASPWEGKNDLYVVGFAKDWSSYVDRLLEKGIEMEKIIFIE